jgi:hypothetical protein
METPALAPKERISRTWYAPGAHGPQRRPMVFLPLFPTQEGGEGWGEEEFLWPLSPALSPLVPRRGEREKNVTLSVRFMGEGAM